MDLDKKYKVVKHGKEITNIDPLEHAKNLIDSGVGEIFINSVNKDGYKNGYDLDFCLNSMMKLKYQLLVVVALDHGRICMSYQ